MSIQPGENLNQFNELFYKLRSHLDEIQELLRPFHEEYTPNLSVNNQEDIRKIQNACLSLKQELINCSSDPISITSETSLTKIRHDICNHINLVQGYTEILIEEFQANYSPYSDDFNRINSLVFHMLKLLHLMTLKPVSSDISSNLPRIAKNLLSTPIPRKDTRIRGEEFQQFKEKYSILIVDDNEESCSMLRSFLIKLGFININIANNGFQALALKDQTDLMLLDIDMPEMSGIEVMMRLRDEIINGRLMVVVITAIDTLENTIECIKFGAEDFLTKPFNQDILNVRINACIEKKWAILQENLYRIEKSRLRMETMIEKNQLILAEVNKDLGSTLEKLGKAQSQLIQAEKMASLGQLIAGINHEINTPAGAITSAVSELNRDYNEFIRKMLFVLMHLPQKDHEVFLHSCKIVTDDAMPHMGTVEIRQIAKDIQPILQAKQVDHSHVFCRHLASIGFNRDNIHILFPLFEIKIAKEIGEFLFSLGMNKLCIRNIQLGIKKISNLIRALKIYSRSDFDQLIVTNIEQDIDTALMILNSKLRYGVTIIKEFESVPEVRCYADQLNQVWINIINNAVDAMKAKGQIIIRIKPSDSEYVIIEIENNGPEIPKEDLSRIFEPYFTTKPKGEGVGLGLSITKQIIDKHKGKIEVESCPQNTLFRIVLPVDTPENINRKS